VGSILQISMKLFGVNICYQIYNSMPHAVYICMWGRWKITKQLSLQLLLFSKRQKCSTSFSNNLVCHPLPNLDFGLDWRWSFGKSSLEEDLERKRSWKDKSCINLSLLEIFGARSFGQIDNSPTHQFINFFHFCFAILSPFHFSSLLLCNLPNVRKG